jgi:hypothetical protein
MPSATKYKLEEARFFLGHLEQRQGQFNKFNFYLSAYVSAAMSVLDTMESEYKRRPPDFSDWFKNAQDSMDEKNKVLLALMYDLRQMAVHEGRLNARASYKVELSHEERQRLVTTPLHGKLAFSLNGSMQNCNMTVEDRETGERTMFRSVKVPLVKRYLLEYRDTELLDSCQRFYALLVHMVADCMARFGVPPPKSRMTRSPSWKLQGKREQKP